MLRDFASGLLLASLTGALYALVAPDLRSPGISDDPGGVLMLTGAMLSSISFMVGWLGSREDRCLRRELAALDERQRSWEETARQQALRLNVYAAPLDSRAAAVKPATVIMFPSLRRARTCALPTPMLG